MKDDVVLEMHERGDLQSFGLVQNGKQCHHVRGEVWPQLVQPRYPGPGNILDLRRNFPFDVDAKRGQLPQGIASSLVVSLQAQEDLVRNRFQLDRVRAGAGKSLLPAAGDRTDQRSADPYRFVKIMAMLPEEYPGSGCIPKSVPQRNALLDPSPGYGVSAWHWPTFLFGQAC